MEVPSSAPPCLHLNTPYHNTLNRARQTRTLQLKNPPRNILRRVLPRHPAATLLDDLPLIKLLVCKVHRAPSLTNLSTLRGFYYRPMHMHPVHPCASKVRQQSRMNIDHLPANHFCDRYQLQIPRQNHPIDRMFIAHPIKTIPINPSLEHQRRNPRPLRLLNTKTFPRPHHHRDRRIQLVSFDMLNQVV